jgi:MoaA/NifB/PqqE/SkfB family radical SAM enzyme
MLMWRHRLLILRRYWLRRSLHLLKWAGAWCFPALAQESAAGPALFNQVWCNRPWDSLALLCDGTVVCFCYDSHKVFPMGNVARSSVEHIWNGWRYRRLRRSLNRGGGIRCKECPAAVRIARGQRPVREVVAPRPPSILYVEPTIRCNLACDHSCAHGALRTRRTLSLLDLRTFCGVIDAIGGDLSLVLFFLYGESLLNPDTPGMIRYTRARNPGAYLLLHTNGNAPCSVPYQEELLTSGLDELVFSIDGATQASYEKYRHGGDVNRALAAMRQFTSLRNRRGLRTPRIIWKYILFRWNDSPAEMDKARELATDIGVDGLNWMLTAHPPGGQSGRFLPGTAAFRSIAHELYPFREFADRDQAFWDEYASRASSPSSSAGT